MKKTIFVIMALMMALVLATSLVACTPVNDDTPCATHTYDNACDTTCNVCGATRNVGAHTDADTNGKCDNCDATMPCTHTYDNGCDTTCNTCGATRNVGAHIDADANAKCDNCGADVLLKDFTATEKEFIIDMVGEVVPFLPTYEYYVEEYVDEYGSSVLYYTYGNTQAEFDAYLDTLEGAGYVLDDTFNDDGDIWYWYIKDDIYIDAVYCEEDGDYIACFYIYLYEPLGGDTIYYDFTAEEKQIFISTIGEEIPFVVNTYYSVTKFASLQEICFLAGGVTAEDYEDYLDALVGVGYSQMGYVEDEDFNRTIYTYQKNDITIEVSYYLYSDTMFFDLTVSYVEDLSGGEGNTGGGEDSGEPNTDFTAEEKQALIDIIGEVIPFLYSSSYTFETGLFEDGSEYVYIYTDENTEEEFEAYLDTLLDAGYAYDGYDYDEDGDIWYYYSKGDILLDICYYEWDTDMFGVDIQVYLDGTTSGGGTSGGNTPATGLPEGTDGVFEVDFTDATNVKNVADLGYYLGGCPTTGNVKVLVIPIEFSDITASSKGYSLDVLEKAFNSKDATDGIYSVYEYFYISSYNQLSLDFEIVNWFRPQYESSYYEASVDADGYMNGDQLIMDEALKYLATIMDLSEFDSDGNEMIDAVVMINTVDVGEDDFHWAYRYWNYHVDEDGYYYMYDDVCANDFLWASYQFIHEAYDEDGYSYYTDTTVLNTYTYIHEFSHVLGADDYYDTTGITSPLENADIMDAMLGDHNAFTKFNYGWITSSRLVVADTSVTLTLEDFSKNGDTIIIANNWDETLGAYQEYYVLMYYTENGVNAGDESGYFAREGIVVYHVNATLCTEVWDGTTLYLYCNSNDDVSGEYGTVNNLIEYVKSANDTFTFVEGDTMPTTYDDNGAVLQYNFVIDSIEGDTATITITKSN